MDFQFRPIEKWPGTLTEKRKRAVFKAGYGQTLDLLERELRHLEARGIVLQVALQIGDIRLDGRPRAGSKASHPGTILAFDSRFGPLSYPCDTYTHWEDNIRAIALSLEHLRAVDRYGVTRRGEQYTGWAQIAGPKNGKMSREDALRFLGAHADMPLDELSNPVLIPSAYRQAALKLHPDRGGDVAEFQRLQEAKDVLGI